MSVLLWEAKRAYGIEGVESWVYDVESRGSRVVRMCATIEWVDDRVLCGLNKEKFA